MLQAWHTIFNNLLSTVLGCVSLAQLKALPDSDVAGLLKDAETNILYGKDITAQLLAFERTTEYYDGNSVLLNNIEKTVKMITYNTKVTVTYELENNLPAVKMSDGTIHQIVTNVIINAIQAMPQGGKIHIKSYVIDIDLDSDLSLKRGRYVCLHVIDNGPGIPEDILDKIFLPYFTTKETGTGLGIPTVFSLITKYGGYFKLNSIVGQGTDAELYFPTELIHY